MSQVRRRIFLTAAGAMAVAPIATLAQRTQGIHRIGFLSPTSPGARDIAFVTGLRALGYIDGQNVSIELRFAEGHPERLPGLVDELVRLKVDVLVVGATIGAHA